MRDLDFSCCFGTLLQVPHLDIVFAFQTNHCILEATRSPGSLTKWLPWVRGVNVQGDKYVVLKALFPLSDMLEETRKR